VLLLSPSFRSGLRTAPLRGTPGNPGRPINKQRLWEVRSGPKIFGRTLLRRRGGAQPRNGAQRDADRTESRGAVGVSSPGREPGKAAQRFEPPRSGRVKLSVEGESIVRANAPAASQRRGRCCSSPELPLGLLTAAAPRKSARKSGGTIRATTVGVRCLLTVAPPPSSPLSLRPLLSLLIFPDASTPPARQRARDTRKATLRSSPWRRVDQSAQSAPSFKLQHNHRQHRPAAIDAS